MLDSNIFWHTNFWGLIGSATGILALVVSTINWRHSMPKIIITKLALVRKNPMQINEWFAGKSADQIRDHIMDFQLNIVLKNMGAAPGSIQKPTLVFSTQSGAKIRIDPYKAYSEPADKLSPAAWKFKSKEQENSWKLGGDEIIEDDIKYVIENVDDLYMLVDNYTTTSYSIEYSDNFGKHYHRAITSVFEEKS
jgi:hypothetical protein